MKTLLTLVFCCLALFGKAENTDSLKRVALGSGPVESRAKAFLALSKLTIDRDSSLAMARQALAMAEKADLEKLNALCRKRVGDIFFDANNYAPALENLLVALRGFEELRDTPAITSTLNQVGNVYSRQDDYKNALQYYRQAAGLRKLSGEDERMGYFGIGKAHEFSKDLDSALFYYQRAYEYYQAIPSNPRTPFVLIHLGNVHLKKNNKLLAITYARMAGDYVKYAKDSSGISSIYTHIAEIFQQTGSRDSAIYYAQLAFQIGLRNNLDDAKHDPALLLADLFANDPAKAYYYYRIGKTIEDSMFSRENLTAIQNTTFNEKERVRLMNEKAQKEEETRKNNIQYAGIGLGLALFCLLFLLLSSSIIVNEKHVKFLGILILLMVFEFLNLVLHPYIGEVTHHSPVLMLLAMVAIAALLIPTHHHLEKWITQKMVKKNKKVRLQTARKIVERLEKENVNSSAY